MADFSNLAIVFCVNTTKSLAYYFLVANKIIIDTYHSLLVDICTGFDVLMIEYLLNVYVTIS